MLIRTPVELDELLAQLRIVRGDHQWVEAKTSKERLPTDLWKSLSAFANSSGGIVLLGIDEGRKFAIGGLAEPAKLAADLGALCGRADPPLRPTIDIVAHPDGAVVVALIAPIPRTQQPCHFPDHGPASQSSYIRVGDADMQLTATEIDEMLSLRATNDTSLRPAPDGARLDEQLLVAAFGASDTNRDLHLQRRGLLAATIRPTLAGWLALGERPEDLTALARVACLREPQTGDPFGTQQAGLHVEGRIGVLLDETMTWLASVLATTQVERGGHLVDASDVPREALREALANALMHRSLSAAMDATSVAVRVSEHLVSIVSPGGLHLGVDQQQLGITPISSPRNYALVRLCEQLRTPSGARIVESQASGIARADLACRAEGTAPLLFVVHPARVTVLALRRSLDPAAIERRWPQLARRPDAVRVVALASRIQDLCNNDPATMLHQVPIDAFLVARLLAPHRPEGVVPLLTELTDMHVLVERPLFGRVAWQLARPAPEPPTSTGARPAGTRVPTELLAALAANPTGLGVRELTNVGLADSTLRKHLKRALDIGLIASTTDSIHDPHRRYTLTQLGQRQLNR